MKKTSKTLSTVSIYTAALFGALSARSSNDNLSASITNLPALPDQGYQLNALNSAGKITGYFFNDNTFSRGFSYVNGNLVDLGTLGGPGSQGRAMNAAGVIVGDAATSSGNSHAALFDGSGIHDLGTLGGSLSSAGAINDAGQVVGNSFAADGVTFEGFFYSNGSMVPMGTFGGSYSGPFSLNNSGIAVGESTDADGNYHAFSFSGGALHDLGNLGGQYAAAFSINDAGVIVGESSTSSGDTHPFIYSGGVMTDIGNLGGSYAGAYFINQSNQVAGEGLIPGDSSYHSFFFENGTMTDLGTLGGPNVYPSGMNDLGQVVGQADTASGGSHAFLWQNGKIVDLNSLLPANSGWELTGAAYINNAGRIVGYGTLNGVDQAFVMDLRLGGNQAPTAVAGPDQSVECGTQVTLDGSKSSDPDGDALAFEWSSAGFVLGTNSTLSGYFALGTNVVTLKVTDPSGATNTAAVTVLVTDSMPPQLNAPSLVTLVAGSNCDAAAPDLSSSISGSDNCSAPSALKFMQTPAAGTSLGLGNHAVQVTLSDESGNIASATVVVSVVDQTAPVILGAPELITIAVGNDCQGVVPNVVSNIVAFDACTPSSQLVVTQNPAAGAAIPKGQSTMVVTVTDLAGNHSSTNVALNVVDQTAPAIISVPGPFTVAVGNGCQGVVPNVLSAVAATDNCTPANQLIVSQSPAAGTSVGKGQYSIVVTVSDAAGNQSTANVSLKVVDQTAPVINSASVSPNVISTPNHQMVPVSVSVSATDNCDAAPVSKIISISCNESVQAGDIVITGPLTASLAATRNGASGGRVYTLTIQCTDNSGNSSQTNVTVTVPQGNGKK